MSRLPQVTQNVASALQLVLGDAAETAALQCGWSQRRRQLSASALVQALTLGFLANPRATRSQLTQAASCAGAKISPQGLTNRLNEKASLLLQKVLEVAVAQALRGPTVPVALLNRFSSVQLQDSTVILLPEFLAEQWPGCGKEQASLKAQVRFDLCTGQMEGPLLTAGRQHDQCAAQHHNPLGKGALLVADLGYFALSVFTELAGRGGYFLSRLKANTLLYATPDTPLALLRRSERSQTYAEKQKRGHQRGQKQGHQRGQKQGHQLSQWLQWVQKSQGVGAQGGVGGVVELSLAMGKDQLPCRVIAVRVPPAVAAQRRVRLEERARRKQQAVSAERLALAEWTVLVTNVPRALLNVKEALVLYRARWQIERLFRLWKEVGEVDQWRSQQRWILLCEIYAKLLGCLLQHWLLLNGAWEDAGRSWHKAAQLVQHHAYALLGSLPHQKHLHSILLTMRRGMSCGCRLEKRKKAPATFQLLLNADLGALS